VAFLGANGVMHAIARWDPDGPGPAAPMLMVGGTFQIAGNAMVQSIAVHDPAKAVRTSFGVSMNGPVHAARLPLDGG